MLVTFTFFVDWQTAITVANSVFSEHLNGKIAWEPRGVLSKVNYFFLALLELMLWSFYLVN